MDNGFVFRDFFKIKSGKVQWRSPSNIALIKYWGKKTGQIPTNPSLSFSLTKCFTTTTITFKKNKSSFPKYHFLFHGQKTPSFESKIDNFFNKILKYCPYISDIEMQIESYNSFPHSSGIASSASSFSALSLCIMEIERILNPQIDDTYFFKKASFISRLGSGSACRSVFEKFSIWGESSIISGSNDLYALPYNKKINNSFNNLCDTILIVDKSNKEFSSTKGHKLMSGHFYAEGRMAQVESNFSKLIESLQSGNYDMFIKTVEQEALALHAMMMTSDPYFILMKSSTLEIIKALWQFRRTSGSKLCFTLDAGANVHIIYPRKEFNNVQNFISEKLLSYCQNGEFINDTIGTGPLKL